MKRRPFVDRSAKDLAGPAEIKLADPRAKILAYPTAFDLADPGRTLRPTSGERFGRPRANASADLGAFDLAYRGR